MNHDLFKTGDKGAPDAVKDRNGEVVLGLCKKCGRAEIELSEPCTPTALEGQIRKEFDRATSYDRSMIPTTEVLAMFERIRVVAHGEEPTVCVCVRGMKCTFPNCSRYFE